MDRRSPFLAGLLAGLGSLTALYGRDEPIRAPFQTASEALRSDWIRVGDDMRRVIAREGK